MGRSFYVGANLVATSLSGFFARLFFTEILCRMSALFIPFQPPLQPCSLCVMNEELTSVTPESSVQTPEQSAQPESESVRPRIPIGSQRNPDAYRPKPAIAAVDPEQNIDSSQESDRANDGHSDEKKEEKNESGTGEEPASEHLRSASFKSGQNFDGTRPWFRSTDEKSLSRDGGTRNEGGTNQDRGPRSAQKRSGGAGPRGRQNGTGEEGSDAQSKGRSQQSLDAVPFQPAAKIPLPQLRGKMSDDLEEEFSALFDGTEMESLFVNVDQVASQELLESDTKLKGKIISVSGEDVFFEIGQRDQGIVPTRQFKEEPQIGQEFDLVVLKFLHEDGLYELSLPLSAADVRDWDQIQEGMILNAKIIKANTGGLECEVNKLRGFIPMSQIAVFRVEKPEEYVGQTLPCVVTEANPSRRNLVLSRKVMLEREREEMREKLQAELEVGQVREGLVRKIIDAGAFVDLGGLDGFIPISALSWGRVRHPSDVLAEGQRIKVKVNRIDTDTKRISLTYRDDADNPWSNIFERFTEKSTARGKVTKIMDFGAFVELMPGVEGLVHISEISHKRIGNVGEVLSEGDWIDVFIQSIDETGRRLSLSMKQLAPEPQPEMTESTDEAVQGGEAGDGMGQRGGKQQGKGKKAEPESVAVPLKVKNLPKGPLKGGVGSGGDGEKFGLKW
ncbi:MAG: S1 RNA-binding domain-containing protein [Thermoguttaceae bacterium]